MMTVRARVWFASALAFAAAPAIADDVSDGESVATESCASCHQVSAHQVIPPPVPDANGELPSSAPSFYDLTAQRTVDVQFLKTATATPAHVGARPSDSDLEALAVYIRSLRTPH